jgi:hypothetical protein
MDSKDLLRHYLATLAFRTRHVLRDAPEGFEDFEVGLDTRSPSQILNHINAILHMTELACRDKKPTLPDELPWIEAIETFHSLLIKLDKTLVKSDLPDEKVYQLFQGPWCDAMTHVGQLAMLRRLYGAPLKSVNYFRAEIKAGHLGPDQPL